MEPFTNLLRRVQNIHRTTHATLEEFTSKYREDTTVAGHCCRAEDGRGGGGRGAVSRLLLWSPCNRPVKPRELIFPTILGYQEPGPKCSYKKREMWHSAVREVSRSRPRPNEYDEDNDSQMNNTL